MTAPKDAHTETEAVATLTRLADSLVPADTLKTNDGRLFALHRNDFALKDITAQNATEILKPKIVMQAVQVQTVESYVDYLNRMKNPNSTTFADINDNKLHGIIDYHEQPSLNEIGAAPAPNHRAHTVTLKMPFSLEWQTWMSRNDRLMSHKEFATFLEHNAQDVLPLAQVSATTEEMEDAPSTLLELTRSLQVLNRVSFNTSMRHGDYDRVDFQKEADATAKGGVMIPVSFSIRIPVYFGEAPVELLCFIRKKVDEDGLQLGYSVNRAENVRQEEFHRIVGLVSADTELCTLYGKPGA